MTVNVRKGTRKDLPGVHALIKELAVYEKAADEVVITVKELEEDGFGPNKIFDFFVAEENPPERQGEGIIGIALYYIKYSTWKGKCIHLEDIVVKESYRGQGIGSKLFDKVIDVSKQMGVKRMEWQVLDWNEAAIHFYKKYPTHFDETWINCRLTEREIGRF